MAGASLSRWTLTYFAGALLSLILVEGLMVGGLGYPSAAIDAPETLILLHLVATLAMPAIATRTQIVEPAPGPGARLCPAPSLLAATPCCKETAMNDFELDVRPILRDGGEPFGAIMGAVNQLAKGQRLKLYATFKPEPLFHVLASQGFAHEASPLENGEWLVIFTPVAGARAAVAVASVDAPETWPDPAHYLDCTELDPPEPMVRILAQLAVMPEGEVLFALLGQEPVFLFPELTARGHGWVGDFDETGEAYRLMVLAGRPS